MKNLTEAQSHLYNLLDEELSVMEHPSCPLKGMRARVVNLVSTLEPYLGRHVDMGKDADLSMINPTAVKELIHYARSASAFDEFLHFASRAIGCLMTPAERREFFGEGVK